MGWHVRGFFPVRAVVATNGDMVRGRERKASMPRGPEKQACQVIVRSAGGRELICKCSIIRSPLRQLDALAGAALDPEGQGTRRRRLARPRVPHRARGVTGTASGAQRRGDCRLSGATPMAG